MNDEQLLKEFDLLVTKLNDTAGTNAKLEILKAVGDPQMIKLIGMIWDPNTTTGVTKKGVEDYQKKKNPLLGKPTVGLLETFQQLVERKLTGDTAKLEVLTLATLHVKYTDLVLRIFEKKPRIRMAEALILKAFPGIFENFKVALAVEYNEKDFQTGLAKYKKAFLSRKLDGVRVLTLIKNESIKFYSRTGNEFTSLELLRVELAEMVASGSLHTNTVLDGEVVLLDKDDKEDFKTAVGQVKQIDKMANPTYFVFDLLTMDEFSLKKESPPLEERLKRLDAIASSKRIRLLEQAEWSPAEQVELLKKAAEKGWEGLMLRLNAQYEAKRTKNLMKLKFKHDDEFIVEDVELADMPFPNAKGGELVKKALKSIKILFRGNVVHVGSGFSTAERVAFAKDPSVIKGKRVTVEYQEEFYDPLNKTYSLRCPIFKSLRPTKD